MHRWLTVLFVFTLFVMSASTVFSQTKPASGAQYLTVQDVEKITGLHGVKLVPADPSKGAGGDLNFANKDGKLILMVQRMPLFRYALFTNQKHERCGEGRHRRGGRCRIYRTGGHLQYFVSFKKRERLRHGGHFFDFHRDSASPGSGQESGSADCLWDVVTHFGHLFKTPKSSRGVAQIVVADVCVMRFRASDPLRGGRDLAGSRTGSSTTATGQERKRGRGRKGGRNG